MSKCSQKTSISDLRESSISQTEVLFQGITFMAPGVGLAFSLGIGVPISGTTLPLSVIVAVLACMFCAISIAQLASQLPSAGGLYVYAIKGIGPRTGFFMGWLYVALSIFMPGSVLTLGGWFINGFLRSEIGLAVGWEFWGLIIAIPLFLMTYFDVRLSMRATVVLGILEIAVFTTLGLYMVGSGVNSKIPFVPSAGAGGWTGIFHGSVFAVLALMGFEASAVLGEEAKNPRRAVSFGIVTSCLAVGLFYTFMTYAWNVGSKFDIVGHNLRTGNSDWAAFGHEYWGRLGSWIIFIALCNSIVACGIAVISNSSRVLFTMGRLGNAPRYLCRVHPRYKSPYLAILTTFIVSGLASYSLAWYFGAALGRGTEGLSGFVVQVTFFTIIGILIYCISCLACFLYFAKYEKPNRKVFLHMVVPLLGIAGFTLPLYSQIFSVNKLFEGHPFAWGYQNASGADVFISKEIPATAAIVGVLSWTLLGTLILWFLSIRRPDFLSRGDVVLIAESPQAEARRSVQGTQTNRTTISGRHTEP